MSVGLRVPVVGSVGFALLLAACGGRGSFRIYTRAPSLNGHFIVNDASLWTDGLDTFVRSIGGG
jgi:hypothetical protein